MRDNVWEGNDTESLSYGTPVSLPSPVGTPVIPESTPLQVIPQFQVCGIVMPSFGEADDSAI